MQYAITPVPKPRMTKSDRWKKRPAVIKYWYFKDSCKELNIKLPEENFHVHFILPMPKSWSKKKRNKMNKQPHKQRPDKDNLEKALLDAIFDEDSMISDSRVSKWWGEQGAIIIEKINPTKFPM